MIQIKKMSENDKTPVEPLICLGYIENIAIVVNKNDPEERYYMFPNGQNDLEGSVIEKERLFPIDDALPLHLRQRIQERFFAT